MVIVVALLTIAGTLLAAPQGKAPDPYEVMDQVRQSANESLWPGFEPLRIPMALSTGRQTFLFNHPNPLQGFIPVGGRLGVAVFQGRHESIAANTSVSLGGVQTATVMLESMESKTAKEMAAVAVHEAFHVFQTIRHGDWSTNEALLFTYPMDEVENQSGLLLEAKALVHAIEARTKADAVRWAACHLKHRLKRYETYPAAAEYERGVELYEGTAHYVEAKMLGKVDDTESLVRPWRPEEIRHRCYFTGKALAGWLDRMNPEWKKTLESGQTKFLDLLLQEGLTSPGIEPARFDEAEIAEVKARTNRAVNELMQNRERAVAEFREKPGMRIILETREDNLLQLNGFDPMNVLRASEKQVLHQRMLVLSSKNGKLQVLGLPALSLGQGPHPLFNGIKRLEIAGLGDALKISEMEDRLTIDTDSLKMSFSRASLKRDGSVVRITLNSEGTNHE